jgi:4'-phosphopantetheinyl transferase
MDAPMDDGPVLRPRPWRLPEQPPLSVLSPAAPLLLLIERREPLDLPLAAALRASLAPAERQRLAALRRPEDQDCFLRARGALRRLLAAELGCPAAAVPIAVGAHGKPHCPGGPAFNLSHSGELILIALHRHCPVGVDVERLRPGLDWQPIARRVLPESQQLALAALPEVERPAAFLQLWCRLEAGLKAAGTGLAAGLAGGLEAPVCHWRLALPAGYLGAVALINAPGAPPAAASPPP